jgi:RNA-binding protein
MTLMTGRQRSKLKSIAHHIKPVIIIGKGGVSESLIAALDKSLSDHELIKVKFNDFKDEKKSLAESVAIRTGAMLVSLIGNIAVLFRQNEDPARRRIVV